MRSILVVAGLSFILASCNSTSSQSLLSDGSGCSAETCTNTPTSIEGVLSMTSDETSYSMNLDKSDVIEVSGKCSDLGIRDHRIRVQVYEGEDTAIEPYLDNDVSLNCIGSTTLSMNNNQCFWVTQGFPIITNDGNHYPQCFNGRFGFSVKLGRILRSIETGGPTADETTNPRRKYLVRYKLIAYPPGEAVKESQWAQATVDRTMTQVSFDQQTNFSSFKTVLSIDAARNLVSSDLTKIKYTGTLSRENYKNEFDPLTPSGSPLNIFDSIGGTISLAYTMSTDISVISWSLINMNGTQGYTLPGVRHKIQVQSIDNIFPFGGGFFSTHNMSLPSNTVEIYGRGTVNITGGNNNPVASCALAANEKTCNLSANFPAVNFGSLEWMIVKGKSTTTWSEDYEPATLVACGGGGGSSAEACNIVSALPAGRLLTITPRTWHGWTCASASDNSYAGNYTVAVRYRNGAFVGAWSEAISCPWN